jgi:hypothetical protein
VLRHHIHPGAASIWEREGTGATDQCRPRRSTFSRAWDMQNQADSLCFLDSSQTIATTAPRRSRSLPRLGGRGRNVVSRRSRSAEGSTGDHSVSPLRAVNDVVVPRAVYGINDAAARWACGLEDICRSLRQQGAFCQSTVDDLQWVGPQGALYQNIVDSVFLPVHNGPDYAGGA